MKARRNSALTCSGVALVATSKSFGRRPDQQVAHRAADDVGLEAGFLQRAHDLDGALVDQRGVDAVLGRGHFGALAERALAGPCRGVGGLAEQLVDEFLDHCLNRSQDAPAALARDGVERRRRVGGHRVVDALEQRQVVDGVAVEGDALEVVPAPARARPATAPRACTLPSRKRRHAVDRAGDRSRRRRARARRRSDRSTPNGVGDRRGDELVGGGDDGHQVAARPGARAPASSAAACSAGAITSRMKRSCAASASAAGRARQARGGESHVVVRRRACRPCSARRTRRCARLKSRGVGPADVH